MATYLGGITLRVTFRNVTVNNSVYTAMSGGDTFTAAVYDAATNAIQGSTVNVTGDGVGNYTAAVTLPGAAGDYYVGANASLASALGRWELPITIIEHQP